MPSYQQLAQELMNASGGVGAALDVSRQQPGVGALDVSRQQPGVGMYGGVGVPAAPGQVAQGQVNYTQAAYDQGGLSWLGFGQTPIAAGAVNIVVPITTLRRSPHNWFTIPRP